MEQFGNVLEVFLIAIVGFAAISMALSVVWAVLQIVANWKVFTKAGERGWKSIIPLYSQYIEFKISWKQNWMFWVWLAATFVTALTSPERFSDGTLSEAPGLLCSLSMIAAAVPMVILPFKKAKAFGKGWLFGLGLFFFAPFFNLVLGFGSSCYRGPQD